MIIRDGAPHERAALEDLQRRASLMWEDLRPLFEANPDLISLPLDNFQPGQVRVAEQDGQVLGFSVLLTRGDGYWLDSVFVEPAHARHGIGGALVRDVLARLGGAPLAMWAHPSARDFYIGQGFADFGLTQTPLGPAHDMRYSAISAQT